MNAFLGAFICLLALAVAFLILAPLWGIGEPEGRRRK
jgi:hypothetical protein